MSVTWTFRGNVLVMIEMDVSTNEELERAFVHEALADARARPGLAVLWDARRSLTPLTAEDVAWRSRVLSELAARKLIARVALLLDAHQTLTAAAAGQRPEIPGLAFGVFRDELEATAWLGA